MKNKIKFLSAAVLILSLLFSALTACSTDNAETASSSQAAETSKIHATDYTYNTAAETEGATKYVHTVPPVPTEKEEHETKSVSHNSSSVQAEATEKSSYGGKIDEQSNGLSIVTKTSPVLKGNSAVVMIQGTPGAVYSIEFYKNDKEKAAYEGICETTADSSGFASWTFNIEDSCESGDRKIIVKEKNSDKFIQTSITIK